MLFVQSSSKTGQRVVAADDTMAGDDDADAIGTNGLCHGSHALWIADALGYLHIASCLAEGDVEQCLPHTALKICAYRVQRNVECREMPCKIVVELIHGLFNDGG